MKQFKVACMMGVNRVYAEQQAQLKTAQETLYCYLMLFYFSLKMLPINAEGGCGARDVTAGFDQCR